MLKWLLRSASSSDSISFCQVLTLGSDQGLSSTAPHFHHLSDGTYLLFSLAATQAFLAARTLSSEEKKKKKPSAYTINRWGDSLCWGNGNMRSAIFPSGPRCQFHANLSQRMGDCPLVCLQNWASWSLYSKALENQSPRRVIDDQKHKCKVLITCTIMEPNRTLLDKSCTYCDASLYFDEVSGSVLWELTSTAVETMWKELDIPLFMSIIN